MPVIGIDLGTTNSCFGYLKDGQLHLIEDERGDFLIPSVVTFTSDSEVLAGSAGLAVAHTYVGEFIYEVKRLIGQSTDNPAVQNDIKRFTFKVKDEFLCPKIVIKNETWDIDLYPEQISGYILKKIVDLASNHLNGQVTEAVITVPAYFGNRQRVATMDAAVLAGIETVHIINEPTAAALAFQHLDKKDFERNVLIYDFGGGTFDVSVVKTQGFHCQVLAVDGDCHLGGTDIDMNVVDFIKKDLFDKLGLDINETDYKRFRRLKAMAESAKINLSQMLRYIIDIEEIYSDMSHQVVITRQQFNEINDNIFQKTMDIVIRCISDAKLQKNQIDEVMLVGGSSRIPKIRDMLKEYFGADKINTSKNPDQMVAYGAAVFAANLYGNKKEGITFDDVLSLSLGTDVTENKMSTIIKRNTPIPCEAFKKYVTVFDDQTEMSIKIYQGERLLASENTLLGEMSITNLTPAPKGKVIVEIKLSVNSEGVLSVAARELNADNEKFLNINMKHYRLSMKDVEEKLKEAKNHGESDARDVEFKTKRIEFEQFCSELTAAAEDFASERKDSVLKKIDFNLQKVLSLRSSEIDAIGRLKSDLLEYLELTRTN